MNAVLQNQRKAIILFGVLCFVFGALLSYQLGAYLENSRIIDVLVSNHTSIIQMKGDYYIITKYNPNPNNSLILENISFEPGGLKK